MTSPSLKELKVRATYRTGANNADPVADFLEPCLAVSAKYDRLSGYFSSRILALAAEGLSEFIAGSGNMRLIMSAHLTPDDFRNLSSYFLAETDYSHLFVNYLNDTALLTSAIEKHHFEAMCWLLKENRLEIRIVAFEQGEATGAPIFHPKVGIFTDALGDSISFSGSVNETAAGWTGNIEEFKVFKSWADESQQEYFQGDRDSFDFYWNGGASPTFVTVPLSKALQDGLIDQAPVDRPTLKRDDSQTSDLVVAKLRNYQESAIEAWVSNGHKGILAMATGTGKTKTAKGCIEEVLNLGTCLVVVTAPYQHIAKQWMDELSFLKPQIASGNNDWRSALANKEQQKKLGWIRNVCVVAVQNTAASENFTSAIEGLSTLFDNVLFVGDEVHGLGATAFQNAMQPFFNMRLGLSATPDRYFDEVGTEVLVEYFDRTVYQFLTSEALAWRDPVTGARALCDYKYFPEFVELADSELQQYEEFSAKIAKYSGRKLDKDEQKALEGLLFKRAADIKCAGSKIPKLESLISESDIEIAHTLIYCFDMEQLLAVSEILHRNGITFQKITGEESNSPDPRYNGLSERDWILKQFGLGTTKILLAIKCLDEGVDVPQAKLAYILASSGNPREFIQRRGRLLRPAANKDFAILHDFVVLPTAHSTSAVASILRKETSRILGLAKDALNFEDVKQLMLDNGLEMPEEQDEN
jgi:superfamily II DNA or RNA helicase